MKCVHLLLFSLLLFLIIPTSAHAQAWSGILDPSRAIDWSQAGVPGGIPTNRTKTCATIAPEGTKAGPVAPNDINKAIASCPVGGVVLLQAGSFYLNGPIEFNGQNNVTLRGAGANQTFLYFFLPAGNGHDIGLGSTDNGNWYGGPSNTANWTAGYPKGATQITLDNVTRIVPGQTIITLDQCDDGYSGSGCATGTATDTGNIFVCGAKTVCSNQIDGSWYRNNRAQQQQVLVTAVSGSGPYTVTISPGLHMPNWRSSQTPGAWWPNNTINGDGVEDLSADNTGSDSSSSGVKYTFNISQCYGCWVKGVRGINGNMDHVSVYLSLHCTVANNLFYGTKNAATQSYGVSVFEASDNLLVNNAFSHVTSAVTSDSSSTGNVYAYNFANDEYYSTDFTFMLQAIGPHTAGSAMDLHEGNETTGDALDNVHGTHNFITIFRNQFWGQDQPYVRRYQNTGAIKASTFSRYTNVIGNVLGTAGWSTVYQDAWPTGSGTQIGPRYTIYFDGYGENYSPLHDALVTTTMMRWGNYDTVTGAVRWCGNTSNPGWSAVCAITSEVPSGLSIYSNPVPASTTLPASFFLSSQPSFWTTPWGTPPWPAIGPDVTGGNAPNVAGHANHIPAQLCWANTPVDPSYQVPYAVTGATWSNGIATLTVAGLPITPEGEFTISGVTPSGYNGTFVMTNSTATTISYALASNPGTYASSGRVLYPNIRLFNGASCYGQSGVPSGGTPPAPPTGLTAVVQ